MVAMGARTKGDFPFCCQPVSQKCLFLCCTVRLAYKVNLLLHTHPSLFNTKHTQMYADISRLSTRYRIFKCFSI